jgi:hypothetical protein
MTAAYHFPLEFAQACADCGAVSDLRRFRLCAACASANVMSLGNVLNRPSLADLRDAEWRQHASESSPFRAIEEGTLWP